MRNKFYYISKLHSFVLFQNMRDKKVTTSNLNLNKIPDYKQR